MSPKLQLNIWDYMPPPSLRTISKNVFNWLTGDDIEFGLRNFGRFVCFSQRYGSGVLAVYVLGETVVHAVVTLVQRSHLQVAVRTFAVFSYVGIVLDQSVVQHPCDRSVWKRFGHARQIDWHLIPRPYFFDHVAGVYRREFHRQMSIFHTFTALLTTEIV